MSDLPKATHLSGEELLRGVSALREPGGVANLPVVVPSEITSSLDRIIDALTYVSSELAPHAEVDSQLLYGMISVAFGWLDGDDTERVQDRYVLSLAARIGRLLAKAEREPGEP